jgi:hypothetical protein
VHRLPLIEEHKRPEPLDLLLRAADRLKVESESPVRVADPAKAAPQVGEVSIHRRNFGQRGKILREESHESPTLLLRLLLMGFIVCCDGDGSRAACILILRHDLDQAQKETMMLDRQIYFLYFSRKNNIFS